MILFRVVILEVAKVTVQGFLHLLRELFLFLFQFRFFLETALQRRESLFCGFLGAPAEFLVGVPGGKSDVEG